MLHEKYPLYLAGEPHAPNADLSVRNKYTHDVAARVAQADSELVERAIAAAYDARGAMRSMAAYQRADVLRSVCDAIRERYEELAHVLAVEVGKPLVFARAEVDRMLDTFQLGAEEATRIGGEVLPLDISARGAGYEGIVKHVPIGVCGLITPFNFPLNLVAHKVAPAIAAGCPWVLKPASSTPISALLLGEILAATDLPPGSWSILPCPGRDTAPLVEDERVNFLSFTGSPEVGWALKSRAGRKFVSLELGGNAGCIVDRGSDLEFAAKRVTAGSFGQAGQSCISVQRVYVHHDIYEEFRGMLLDEAAALKVGDPFGDDVTVGPLITEDDAKRVESWVGEAVDSGATLLCGGTRDGAVYAPTWLEGVDPEQKVSCAEVFGPVATLEPFVEFEEAVRRVNASDFGLQAGVFTPRLDHAHYAFDSLEVGGVVVNDIPSVRVDCMPYGGVKQSGHGREGVRYAIEEMTERRMMVLRQAGKL